MTTLFLPGLRLLRKTAKTALELRLAKPVSSSDKKDILGHRNNIGRNAAVPASATKDMIQVQVGFPEKLNIVKKTNPIVLPGFKIF
jgi:hypothetical protein